MSRDWTPREKYMANELLKKSRGSGMEDIRFTYHVNGETRELPAISDSYYYRDYPTLCLLLGEDYIQQMEPILCRYTEEKVQTLIQMERKNGTLPTTSISKWYQGKLGRSMEENHQALLTHLDQQMIPSLDGIWKEEEGIYMSNQNGITYTLYQVHEDPLDGWHPEIHYVIEMDGYKKHYETHTKDYEKVLHLYQALSGCEQERGMEI